MPLGLTASTANAMLAGALCTVCEGAVNTSSGFRFPLTLTLALSEVLSVRATVTVKVLLPTCKGTMAL